MKKKIIVFLSICMITLSLTGCTTYVKDKKGAPVKEPTTGQTLAENILCKPTNKNVVETYKKYKVDIKKLPDCKDFTPASGEYSGLWETLFVKPLSFLIVQMGEILNNYGLAIIIITLLIRLVIYPLSKKSAMQSENMKKAQKDMQKVEKKYRNRDSQQDQVLKSQEMMSVYKKYDINPMSGCLFSFIQLPLFLAFLESLNRLPIIFEGKFLCFHLGMSPITKIFGDNISINKFFESFTNGSWVYILLPIMVGFATYFSFKMNSGINTGNDDQQKQMKMFMNFMLVFIIFTSLTMPTSIILYWIVNSLFTVIQAAIVRRKNHEVRNNTKRIKK